MGLRAMLPVQPGNPIMKADRMVSESFSWFTSQRRRMGDWAFARYLRNQGLSLPQTHLVMFGVPPRFPG